MKYVLTLIIIVNSMMESTLASGQDWAILKIYHDSNLELDAIDNLFSWSSWAIASQKAGYPCASE